MENEIIERLKKNEEMLEKISISVEKTRKYLYWTFVVTVIVLVLPMFALLLAIPSFLSTISQMSSISGF